MHPPASKGLIRIFLVTASVLYAQSTWAADDYGVTSTLDTPFEVSGPTTTEFKGRTLMYMNGGNGIFFSGEENDGWSSPRSAFAKPGYRVSDPSIVKHPRSNEYYMFYTMRKAQPEEKVMVDRRSGKRMKVVVQPTDAIGVAYATSCNASPDGSGLCWTDKSGSTPLIGDRDTMKGGAGPSVHLEGAKAVIYYKSNPPDPQIVRSTVDIRDWKVETTKPLTFQSFDPIRKTWQKAPPRISAAISNVDVAPYGKGYLMVGNDGSQSAISRWKSENGINFYYDPYDGNSPIVRGGYSSVKAPHVVPVGDHQFKVYYAYGDAGSECSKKRFGYGSLRPCSRAVQMRMMSEEKDPEIMENYYFSKGYKKPDYGSVTPMEDIYTQYKKDPTKYNAKMTEPLRKAKENIAKSAKTAKPSTKKEDKGGFFDRLWGR